MKHGSRKGDAVGGRVAIGVAVAATALVVLRVLGYSPTPVPEQPLDRPVIRVEEGYVTSKTCRACHPSQYETWHASYHRRMTQLATPDAFMAEVDGLELDLGSLEYRFERLGEETWVNIAYGDETPDERHRIVMTTGSHHRQWLWFATGTERRLGTVPFIYLKDEQRWVPRNAAFLEPPQPGWIPGHQEGAWSSTCVNCHTTRGEVKTAGNDGASATEFGISCEACHGPAEQHVDLSRDPQRRYRYHLGEERDPTMINPATLPHPRSSEVCGQCHSIIAARTAYQPGDDLEAVVRRESRKELMPEVSRWSDGMVRTGGREYDALIETGCFQRGEMSCLTCHSMHRAEGDAREEHDWADDQMIPDMESDQACLQCHVERYDLERHTHHKPESTGSRCYNCHMPYTNFALLKAIRNHQVTPPTVASTLETGRPNACNLCHLDQSLGWTAKYLAEWTGKPQPELTEDQQTIASSVLWATRGNAGQRALLAWHMGWEPARAASGDKWLAPYLTLLMNDPYPAVRLMAWKSMRTSGEYEALDFDYIAPAESRQTVLRNAVEIWNTQTSKHTKTGRAILIRPDGRLDQGEFVRLVNDRDDTPIRWIE